MADNRLTDEEAQVFSDLVSGKHINVRKLTGDELKRLSLAIHFLCEEHRASALRAAFAHVAPFIDENCPTAYTDCRYRVGFGPDAFDPDKTTIPQLAMLLLHEVLHNTQNHRQRLLEKKGLSAKITNVCTDLEINNNIAAGVCGIDLHGNPCDETPNNGHWDWLFGGGDDSGQLKLDEEKAEMLNSRMNNQGKPARGRTYKSGDWAYIGGLVPGQGIFYDLPLDLTAEQYLAYLEVDTEDMTLKQFAQKASENRKDNQNSGDGGNGQTGEGSNSNSDSSNSSGNGAPSDGENDNSGDGSGSAGNEGSGSNGGAPASDGSGNVLAGPDGSGGYAINTGDGHVQIEKVSVRHSDGSKSTIERDAYMDNINVDPDSELWKQVSSQLGIEPITRGEEQKVRDQIAHDIEEERRSNSYGYGAGNMLLNYVSKGLRPPIVNWRRVLRKSATKVTEAMRKGRDDYSFKRISRRRTGSEFIFPGMVDYVPRIRLAIDTSGSMSEREYRNVLSEAEGILKNTHAKLEVVCVDTVASDVIKVKSIKEITQKLVGGGGTDMSVAVQQVCEETPKNRPDVLIVATDGCFNWDSYAESMSDPKFKNTAIITVVVYKFTDDAYYAKQGELAQYQQLCRLYKRDAIVVQAFAK